jgi:16S rRNA (uracil1498-N3)-methyltransferase
VVGGGGAPAVITVLVPPGTSAGRRGQLDDSEQHHLRVRRAQPGELVGLRDGAGLVGTGRLVAAARGWEVEVETIERHARPPELTLAVGAGDRDRFAWLVEKAVELGVTRVIPLETGRTAGVASRLREQHLDRLRRQALEAIKQCGVAWTTDVSPPVELAELAAHPPSSVRWLADAEGDAAPATLDGTPVTIVIGPEGGLSEEERATLAAAGFLPLALSSHTLRFETAAVAAAAVVSTARLRGMHG